MRDDAGDKAQIGFVVAKSPTRHLPDSRRRPHQRVRPAASATGRLELHYWQAIVFCDCTPVWETKLIIMHSGRSIGNIHPDPSKQELQANDKLIHRLVDLTRRISRLGRSSGSGIRYLGKAALSSTYLLQCTLGT